MGDDEARKNPITWGIDAIEALRRDCDPNLKIIAYSNWPYLRGEAITAGANDFLSKAASGDAIRRMIRHVMAREDFPPDDPYNLGRLRAIELFVDRRGLILVGNFQTEPIYLDPASFALLHYLAHERLQGAEHWVERIGDGGGGISQYHMKEPDLWHAIAEQHHLPVHFCEDRIDTANIAQWATRIHRQLRRWHDNTRKLTLIRVPGTRKRRGEATYYTLHPGITRQHIIIHDD